MPMYTWYNPTGDIVLDVLRDIDDRQSPPTVKEVREKWPDSFTDIPRQGWERMIGEGVRTIKGPAWGRGKGHW